jgi:hypothetical protein
MNVFNANTPFAARVQTVQTIEQAYEAALAASMDRASYNAWRFGLLTLLIVLFGGVVAALALTVGLSDPTRGANLIYQAESLDGLAQAGSIDDVRLYVLPDVPPAPFTLEVVGSNGSGEGAAWGVWLEADDVDRVLLVDNRGYMLSTLYASKPEWREFMHIQSPSNRLYIHVENGQAVFRINQEWVTAIPIERIDGVGLALSGDPQMAWEHITLWKR